MNSNIKTIIFWAVLICVAVVLWAVVKTNRGKPEKQITFTDFIKQVDESNIKNVAITGNEVKGDFINENASFRTLKPPNYPDFYKMLLDKKIPFEEKDTGGLSLGVLLVNASPFILLLAFWIFMMRQMQSGGNKALSFGKSRARLHSTQQKKVTFRDVAGVEEAKEELKEMIEFAGDRQDAAGPRDRRGGQRSLFLDLRFGLR